MTLHLPAVESTKGMFNEALFSCFKDGAILERGAYGAANTYTFTAAAAGTYTVRVYAKDSANRVITLDKAAPVTVTTNAPLVITGVAADKPSAVPGPASLSLVL